MTLIEHWEENKREDFDGGRQKDKTVIQYLWGISDSKLFHWEMSLMTDLILGSDIAAGLYIRTKTADDNIYGNKKKGGERCSFSATTSSSGGSSSASAKCPQQKCSLSSHSDRLSFIISNQASSPAKPNIFIDSAIFLCQLVSRRLSAWKSNTSLRSEKEPNAGRKKVARSLRLSELFIAALLPHSTLTSLETPAALRWLSSSNYLVGSTLTQLRLYSSSSSSSAPASSVKSKTSSLTSTPTRLQNRYQHKLCSDCF